MKRILFLISILLILSSCNGIADGDTIPPSLPDIQVLNEENIDLLDPNVLGHFSKKNIKFWTIRNNVNQEISFEIVDNSGDEYDFVYKGFFLSSRDKDFGLMEIENYNREYYLSLREGHIDTICFKLRNGVVIGYELNGKEWKKEKKGYLILYK